MATVKTIKDVDEDKWLEFKSIAARNDMKMGKLFEEMVEEYKKKTNDFWEEILKGPAAISEKEAKATRHEVRGACPGAQTADRARGRSRL